MKALVSGATGFVGSHLQPRLIAEGWQVGVVGRSYYQADETVTSIVDTGSVEALTTAVVDFDPDVVFHLATKFVAQHQAADINDLMEANLSFGTRLLDACAQLDDVAFVNVGTLWQHYNSRPYSPVSLYAATKQAFADVVRYYAECTSVRAVTVELSDTYGPGDTRRKLVQLLIERALSGDELMMSPGEQFISLIHIADAVDALVHAPAQATHDAPLFSVPSTETLNLQDLVKRVNMVTGKTVPVTFGATPYRPREMMSPWNASPPLPNWLPRIGLDQGLKELLAATHD